MTRGWWQTHRRAPGRPGAALVLWWSGVSTIVYWFFKVFYRLRVYGRKYVPLTGPVIYVSNHQTNYDPCLAGLVVTDRPFRAMARVSLFKNPVLAWVMRSIGAIELDRDKGDAGAFKAALAELDAGRCVLMFPEGTRTRDGTIGEFKRGIALLIKRSGASVMPIAIEGAHEVWPIGHTLPRLTGRIAVTGGPVITDDELMKDGPDAASDRLRREIDRMRLRLRERLRRGSGGRYPLAGPGDVPIP